MPKSSAASPVIFRPSKPRAKKTSEKEEQSLTTDNLHSSRDMAFDKRLHDGEVDTGQNFIAHVVYGGFVFVADH